MKITQRVNRGVRAVVPPARIPVRWTDAVPLLVFSLIYAFVIWRLSSPATVAVYRWGLLACGIIAISAWWIQTNGVIRGWFPRRVLGLLWRLTLWSLLLTGDLIAARLGYPLGSLVFTRPMNFLWFAAAVWVWWMSLQGWSGLNRTRALQSLLVRLAVLGAFVMLLAEPRSVRTSDNLSVVYAVDVSASIHPDQVNEALKFVTRTVVEKPQNDQAGLVIFGSSAAVELPPEHSFPFDKNSPEGTIYLNSRIDRDATNLEQALSLSAAILPEDSRGRIVLISDGSETAGQLKSVLQQLQSRGIAVDVLPVTYNYDNEMWVERLELPQTVKIGEPYSASVVVSSLKAGKAKLILEENTKPIREEPFEVELQEGKTRVEIPLFLREPGYYEYKATLLPEDGADGRNENNEAFSYIFVEGEGKVLIVRDPLRKNERDYDRLAQAIVEGERTAEIIDAFELPSDPLSLMPYDCIIFANVAQDTFDPAQLKAVHDAVFNQGIGFIMVGGQNSFGAGGYHRTVIEDALPVTMDITKKKVLPKGALAIILHTCEFPEGNTWAKRITKQAIKVLGAEDEVGVIGYGNTGEYWIFEMTPAGEYDSLVPKINAAVIGDMPAFGPTMQMGLTGLMKTDAASRHMIIISDGDPSLPAPNLLQDFIDAQVSISTISIFPHGGREIGTMRDIATVTNGRYYFPTDPNELPAIFIKEAKTLKRNMIQEKELHPQSGFPSTILEGIDGLPPLHGFVLTSLKENALTENVLYAVADDAAEGETDPVLAVWRYGLGTTAAFTSSLSNQWAKDWVSWEKYRAFVKQMVIRVSRVRKAGQLRMWTANSGGEGVITVEDFHPEEMFLDVTAQVNGPGNTQLTVPLKQVGPRRYQGTFPAGEKGRYQVTAIGTAGEREDRIMGGFIVSYSAEFLKFTSSWNNLRLVKEMTGGAELSPASTTQDIYNRRVPKQSSQPVFDWFLMAIAILIPLDVAVRRVQLDWSVVRAALGLGRKAESQKTMGALLARKEQVTSQMKPREGERPLLPPKKSPFPSGRRDAPPPPPPNPNAPKPPAGRPEQTSTTSRLLDAKRKRQEES